MKLSRPGIFELPDHIDRKYRKKPIALLCHTASIDPEGTHILSLLEEERAKVVALFGPQHGIRGETQDNMIEWEGFEDEKGRPVYSLYGKTRIPTDESLEGVEAVVVDLQDIGGRVYTFIYTLFYMMEVCGRLGIPVIVCDRPNPIGGELVEGNLLNLDYKSFVGLHPIPMVHGMTVGELALYFADQLETPPPLEILKLKRWSRKMHWPETGLPWVLPSPNMPNYEAAVLFPGIVLLEGTTLSEGRGTTRPFELIGAPFIEWDKVEKKYQKLCEKLGVEPVVFVRQGFIPTFHKFKGELCLGALQLIRRPKKFQPLRSAAILLWILRDLYGDAWAWKEPPYEYEYEKLPIDMIMGSPELRECIDSGGSLKKLFSHWQDDENQFKKARKPYLLY